MSGADERLQLSQYAVSDPSVGNRPKGPAPSDDRIPPGNGGLSP